MVKPLEFTYFGRPDSTVKRNYINMCQNLYPCLSVLQTAEFGKTRKGNVRVIAFTKEKTGTSGDNILESNLRNVVNVIGFSSNIYMFWVVTELMEGRNYSNIMNMEILSNSVSSGFTRICAFVMNVVIFSASSHNQLLSQ